MELLPDEHKAKWFAGAALNTAEQSMASVMSTALSRLNAFLDSELEQILCFDTEIDAERFCNEISAIFLVMPEENPNTFFMISLIMQQLYREILSVADENGGKLKNRCVFFADEFGTLPKIESAEMMFSASHSRRLQMIERPLMTPDELKSLPKGNFIVMKTGCYPMRVKLKLFFKWGIDFEEPYEMIEQGNREVKYANKNELIDEIIRKYHPEWTDPDEENEVENNTSSGGQSQAQAHEQAPADNKSETIINTAKPSKESVPQKVKVEPPARIEGEQDRQT